MHWSAKVAEIPGREHRELLLRKRTRKLFDGLAAVPDRKWRRVRLTTVGREYRTPQVLGRKVCITGYPGDILSSDAGHVHVQIPLHAGLRQGRSQWRG